MITQTIQIRYGPKPIRPATAVFIAGADPSVWLAELAKSRMPHLDLRLHVVPHSVDDRRPLGVVATSVAKSEGSVCTHGVRYGTVSKRLYLPVEASFDPDLDENELTALLNSNYTYVWHPTAGLIAFEPKDVLRVSDLIEGDETTDSCWNAAQPGIAFNDRLVSLEPDAELSIDMLIEHTRDDIGTDPSSLDQLPPSPLEPKPGMISSIGRAAKSKIAGAIRRLTQMVPAKADEPTWINRLDDWAARQLAQISESLAAARNKEIARLMHMLDTDPDEGLRHALPFGGGAGRGQANPGGQLGTSNVDFDLAGLGGGGAADYWEPPLDYQVELMRRYRELADREIRLGRYRRAAYIFAKLLDDLPAAARTLTAGRHWREAAVLYEKKLNQPLEAARCLREGGLWSEAIAIYQQWEEFETAGDLYTRLEQPESARESYQQAVIKSKNRGDLIDAARLLDEKLHDTDEAIEQLAEGWPDSPQALKCLQGVFQILGREGRHDQAQDWIRGFREEHHQQRTERLVELLVDTAGGYPDRDVERLAEDCARVLVARRLPSASNSESRGLLNHISRLVPEDRLLGRDCQRYIRQRSLPRPKTKKPRPKQPTLLREFTLPAGVDWLKAIVCRRQIIAAGYRGNELIVCRCNWNGDVQQPTGRPWRVNSEYRSELILSADPISDSHVLVHVPFEVFQPERKFSPVDLFPDEITLGPTQGLPSVAVAAARSGLKETWFVEYAGNSFSIASVTNNGQPLMTRTLPPFSSLVDDADEFMDGVATPHWPPLIVPGNAGVYVAIGQTLITVRRSGDIDRQTFGSRIHSLHGSVRGTTQRVMLTFACGGVVVWEDYDAGHQEPFANDLANPVIGLNRSGHLIAASENRCEVYSTQKRTLQLVTEIRDLPRPPVAVLCGERLKEFGIMSADGTIAVYELPG